MDLIDYGWSIAMALGFTFVFMAYLFPAIINLTVAITQL